MPFRCVVGGCSNYPDKNKGIGLHKIPFVDDHRPEAKKRRKRWINFVRLKRAKWEPSKFSSVCSAHFNPSDFMRLFTVITGQTKAYLPRLKTDDFGIVVFPSVPSIKPQEPEKPVLSARTRRKVLKEILMAPSTLEPKPSTSTSSPSSELKVKTESSDHICANVGDDQIHVADFLLPSQPVTSHDACTQTQTDCEECSRLLEKNSILGNKLVEVRERLRKQKVTIYKLLTELKKTAKTAREDDEESKESVEESDVEDNIIKEEPSMSNDS